MSRFISIDEILHRGKWATTPASRAKAEDGQAKVDIIPDRIHGDEIKEEVPVAPIETAPVEKPTVVETPVNLEPMDEQASSVEPIAEPADEANVVEEVPEKKAPAKKSSPKAKKAE